MTNVLMDRQTDSGIRNNGAKVAGRLVSRALLSVED